MRPLLRCSSAAGVVFERSRHKIATPVASVVVVAIVGVGHKAAVVVLDGPHSAPNMVFRI